MRIGPLRGLFFCFCFSFFLLFTFQNHLNLFVLGLPKWKFSTRKKHFMLGKKSGKMTLPPQKKYSVTLLYEWALSISFGILVSGQYYPSWITTVNVLICLINKQTKGSSLYQQQTNKQMGKNNCNKQTNNQNKFQNIVRGPQTASFACRCDLWMMQIGTQP